MKMRSEIYELICPRCGEPRYGESRVECAEKMQGHLSARHGLSPRLSDLESWAKELLLTRKQAAALEETKPVAMATPADGQQMLGI